ncbi:hypothetical protein NUKP64_48190 [Klebsiella variicola]|nr:hypothetical protein NUKP64_48190 [Klebsiella variicola]
MARRLLQTTYGAALFSVTRRENARWSPPNNAVAEQCLQRDRWAAIFHYTNFQNGVLLAQKEGIFYAKNHEAPG